MPYQLNHEARLTFWDYTHAPIQELVKHPDYSLTRFTRITQALGEAMSIIEAAQARGEI